MEISNPDKVLFPEHGYTKADLIGYYDSVADRMLPWLTGRPLTLERYPNGVGAKGFMQKNASTHFSEHIRRVEVPKSDGTVTHPVVDDRHGLVELANQAAISFHVWTAAAPDLDRPTHLVLDLDPEAGDTEAVRSVAWTTKVVLGEFGLDGLAVASGKKGFHVWVPVAGLDYDTCGLVSRAMAGLVASRLPDQATTEFLKKHRRGRVFVDWLRNRRAQSIVAPWSVRVTDEATVAVPVSWDELDRSSPAGWTIRTAPDRLDLRPPDPFDIDPDTVVGAARERGLDLDSEFDRFGRT